MSKSTRISYVIMAVALVLIGFSQTAGDARMFAARHRYRIDINQESVGQGMANVGARPAGISIESSVSGDRSGIGGLSPWLGPT